MYFQRDQLFSFWRTRLFVPDAAGSRRAQGSSSSGRENSGPPTWAP